MTSGEATGKVHKLLALAAPGSGATPDEAATAAQLAHQICAKYEVRHLAVTTEPRTER